MLGKGGIYLTSLVAAVALLEPNMPCGQVAFLVQMSGQFCYQNRIRTYILKPFPTLQNCYNLLKSAILTTKIIYPFRPKVLKKGT
jgi:hypothetical protein